jgi:Asp/Glu/hydantoin racemase
VTEILLINPNSSVATTEMMVRIAASTAPDGFNIRGATATRGPPMIVSKSQLAASADEVVAIGLSEAPSVSGIIVGAFGDPGLDTLLRSITIPAAGLCEAAMREAASTSRRFGVATTTPDLAAVINAKPAELGLNDLYTGIRLTPGDPLLLTQDLDRLDIALETAIRECVDLDGAEAVIIGGGPLAQAASRLAPRFGIPIIEPIPAALRQLVDHLKNTDTDPA